MQSSANPTSAANVQQLLAVQHPGQRWAISAKQHAIGIWSHSAERYVAICQLTIDGRWALMPFEIQVNGKRIEWDWQAVEGGAQ